MQAKRKPNKIKNCTIMLNVIEKMMLQNENYSDEDNDIIIYYNQEGKDDCNKNEV